MLLACTPRGGAVQARAQESLADAKKLYADAAYEPALALLNRLRPVASGDAARDVETTRALCLLALGLEAQAREAFAAVVDLDPLFRISDQEVAPRVVAIFGDVRAARLPGVARQRFNAARDAFGRKDYAAAAAGFQLVRTLLDLPEMQAGPDAATFKDLRTLAAGFHDLAITSVPPHPEPAGPPPNAAAPATPRDTTATPPEPVAPAPSSAAASSSGVEEPVVLDQRVMNWSQLRRPGRPLYRATLSVVIDERGRVESTRVLDSNDRFADPYVVAAVQQWRYKPATRGGVPVKYTKVVAVTEPAQPE
jgi:protein TonB